MQTRERAHFARSVLPFIKKKKSIFSISILLDKSIVFCIPSGGTVELVWMKGHSYCN